jgi:hypothetical protein
MSVSDASWMAAIHARNPYEGFPIEKYKRDIQGWGSDSPIFDALISQRRPTRIIEVGSFKGASAIHMADTIRKCAYQGEIVCVDTWLGTVTHWLERMDDMEFGRPTVYYQFLANIIHSGHTGTIVPFPVDSITGAQFFTERKMAADAIYIDAGHDYAHVMSDLRAWWPILRPGGLMFGDDYHLMWLGVVRAVHDFAEQSGLQVHLNFPDKWLIEKAG